MISDKLLFLGDTFLPRSYHAEMSGNIPFIINLEAPLTKNGHPIPGKINLVCRNDNIKSTFHRFPLAVCLANNHIMDYGKEGFLDTLKVLKKHGIKYFGAGEFGDNFNNPLVIDCKTISVALFGYCYPEHIEEIKKAGLKHSPAPLDFNRIGKGVERYINKVDRIIVCLHWGVEESHIPDIQQVKMARKIIDLGASAVIGHHAHVMQPVEKYKEGIIAYGLGNFIFDDLDAPRNCDSAGIPQDLYFKKQRKWNRSSLGILVHLNNLNFEVKHFYFKRDIVTLKTNRYHRYATFQIPENLAILKSAKEKHYRIFRIKHLLCTYIDRPKIPKFKGIVNFVKLICFSKNRNC